MTAPEFEARIINWARARSDIVALIQIGSRVQSNGLIDAWSDWDYHLIVNDPKRYRNTAWLDEIAPCWSSHLDFTERGVFKLSAVFAGGWEVDFIPLADWQMKLVYWAMARPGLRAIYPQPLIKGIGNTQLVVGPGYRIVIGGAAWETRLSALKVDWPRRVVSAQDCSDTVGGFWRHAVWVHKKIMRGETRAAQRWLHREVVERRWALLEEEARLAGRASRPEARKAEQWLDGRRLEQTAIATSVDRQVLARALLAELDLFEDVSRSVASSRNFTLADYSAVAAWMRSELTKLAGPR